MMGYDLNTTDATAGLGRSTLRDVDRELARMTAELRIMQTAGIIEVAIRNPSVADYMRHWEGRAEAAEATVADLTAKLAKSEEMRDHYLDAAYKATGLNQDLTAANIALAAECARLKGRDEVLRAIADLTEISGLEFAEKHPELNKLLDKAGYENWGKVLSEFAARAYLAGGE